MVAASKPACAALVAAVWRIVCGVNHYLIPGEQLTCREAAGNIADRLGLPSPQTTRERVMGDVGEALTGTGLTMGVGGLLGAGRGVARAAPTAAQKVGNFLTAQPALQTAATATGAGASSATREAGGGTGAGNIRNLFLYPPDKDGVQVIPISKADGHLPPT